jgi:glycosyltransferase involved in cell wall biosynthesis
MALRVLLTCKYLPPELEGGGALTVLALARALEREGLEVTILKAQFPEETDRRSWEGLRIHETEYRDRFDYRERGMPDFYAHLAAKRFNHRSYRRALRKLAATEQFDVVHAQNHTTALAAASLRDELATPIAATLRGHGLWCFVLGKALPDGTPCSGCVTENQVPCLGGRGVVSPPTIAPALALMKSWMRRQRRLAERIDLMLPISTMMAEEARPYGRPTRVIPDLVEELGVGAPLPDDLRARVDEGRRGRRIALYAGRLAPNKGLDLVLDAAERSPEWLVVVAGGDAKGGYAETLNVRASRMENVRLVGRVANAAMPSLYDAADVVLLPFVRPEPLSRGMVEALSRGRALAATAQGGPLDAVEDGANGALFAPTADGLVEALRRLADADLAAMGRRSREVYERKFDPRHVVAAHLDAYASLVGGAHG